MEIIINVTEDITLKNRYTNVFGVEQESDNGFVNIILKGHEVQIEISRLISALNKFN